MALRINETVGLYQVVETAARGPRALYLTTRNVAEGFYWLLESDQRLDEVRSVFGGADLFAHGDRHYAAIEVTVPTLAGLLTLVPALDAAFIGWRWVNLAESAGNLHRAGQSLMRERSLALESLRFTRSSQLSLSPFASPANAAQAFRAPETQQGMATAPADVYVLGAALQAALGEGAGGGRVAALLARATSADPGQRPADGHRLATDLKRVLPSRQFGDLKEAPPEKERKRGSPLFALDRAIMACGPIAAFGMLVLGLLVFRDGLPAGLRFDWLPDFGALGIGKPDSVTGGRGRGTAVPLPEGPLTFAGFTLEVNAPCAVRLDVILHKGGVALPAGAAADFDVWLDGRIVTGVVVAPAGETVRGGYQVIFNAPGFCPGGGAVVLRARVTGAEADLSLCDFGRPGDVDSVNSLQGLSFVAAQADATAYPAMTAYFTAADAQGIAARLRGAFRCRLLQDEKEIKEFAFRAIDNERAPVTVALVMDVSGSMAGQPLAHAQQAAREFVRQLGAAQSVCIITFGNTVQRVQECSTDRAATAKAIDGLTAAGSTALYDAIVNVATTQRRLGGRQAVVLLSDGKDTVGRSTLSTAIERARGSNIPYYTLGLLSPDFDGAILREIAAQTGGVYFEAPNSGMLADLYQKVRGHLTTQYQLRFSALTADKASGTFSLHVSDGDRTLTLTRPFVSQAP